MFRYSIIVFLTGFISLQSTAQQVLTENEAVAKALANNKNIQAASLQVKQQQQLLKSAINLPNPEFFLESPTGNFYTGSITQSFEFPTVYNNQYRLQKRQIGVAQKEKQLTEAELKYRVKILYLEIQYADSLTSQLYIQDTLYEKIKLSAIRQFKAGQIDYLQQTFAETQYGEIHNQYQQSLIRAASLKSQLQWFTGIKDSISVEPLVVTQSQPQFLYAPDSTTLLSNPAVQLLQQQENVAKQNILLQKSKALPGLAFGYFNQGERTTKWLNRFRVGVTIPLWFGQYKSKINAAKTEQEVIQSKQQGLQQDLSAQVISANSEMQTNWQSVQYYQQTGLRKAQEVITTSQRFFVSGEIDYISLLRNSNDAYNVYQKYLEAVRNYNLSVINHKYLMGQL
ncbi:MAG: TolC family protein [Sediminibacterium sp.]|jgi:cobalt-zinc-cadmium efflux system outer membrane protein|nr:TolC family protein [Asinibacterium sp. OR53]MBR2647937.1 TolC family protein [Sediminibacterium sp.]MCA6445614.1 TolC family protein [Chitinophagaceae bacterium]